MNSAIIFENFEYFCPDNSYNKKIIKNRIFYQKHNIIYCSSKFSPRIAIFIDEGTIYGYVPKGFPACASQNLSFKIKNDFIADQIAFNSTYTWTTDCRFKETVDKISMLSKIGIDAVDMETSALYTISKSFNIEVLSLGIVTVLVKIKLMKNIIFL